MNNSKIIDQKYTVALQDIVERFHEIFTEDKPHLGSYYAHFNDGYTLDQFYEDSNLEDDFGERVNEIFTSNNKETVLKDINILNMGIKNTSSDIAEIIQIIANDTNSISLDTEDGKWWIKTVTKLGNLFNELNDMSLEIEQILKAM